MDRRTALSWMGFGAGVASWSVAAAGSDPASEWQGVVLEWPHETPHPVTTALGVAPSQLLFASGGDDHLIHLWQLEPPKVLGRFTGHRDWVRSVLFVDEDRLVSASNDGTLRLWHRRRDLDRQPGTVLQRAAAPWTALASSPDRKHWAAVSFSGEVVWFDAQHLRRLGQVELATNDLRCAAFSPNTKELAVAGRDGRIYRIDLAGASVVESRNTHHRRRRGLIYLNERRLLSVGDDGILCGFDAGKPEACRDVPIGRARIDCLLRWDDRHVAVGGSDNVIRMIDVERGQVTAQLKGHTGTVAVLRRIGPRLLSGSYDTSIRLWTPKHAVARRPAGRWRAR